MSSSSPQCAGQNAVSPSELLIRIRHYGFLANRRKQAKLAGIRELLDAAPPPPRSATPTTEQWLQDVLGIDTSCCPCCGERPQQTQLMPRPEAIVLLARVGSRGPPGER